MIKKSATIFDDLKRLREKGNPRGQDTGFVALDALYSIKQGSYTFVLASPHHGKSEFCFELCINQAFKYGKKSLIYSPETGSVEDIYAEFVHKLTGQSIYKSVHNHLDDDKKFYDTLDFIDNNFSIVDSDESNYSFEDLTNLVTNESIILADPYNEMKHDMLIFGARQDLYIEDLIGRVRRYCKKNNKHTILTLHPAHQQIIRDGGLAYYPSPVAREAAGGQALFRKAMTWINLWRPPNGFIQDGQTFKDNEVLVTIEKAKPKGVSVKGQCSLFFDWHKNRYYEEFNGQSFYFEQLEKYQKENIIPVQNTFEI